MTDVFSSPFGDSALLGSQALAQLRYATVEGEYDDEESIARLIDGVISPASTFPRITETLTLGAVTLRRDTTLEVAVPRSGRADESNVRFPVPVATTKKGNLLPQLDVKVDGSDAAVFPNDLNTSVTLFALRHLYNLATGLGAGEPTEADFAAYEVLARVTSDPNPVSHTGRFHAWMRQHVEPMLTGPRASGVAEPHKDRLRRNVKYFADYFNLYVEVSASPSGYQLVCVSFSDGDAGGRMPFEDAVRRMFGLQVMNFEIPLYAAVGGSSYHMRCAAPPETYVSSLDFDLRVEKRKVALGVGGIGADSGVDLRFARTLGEDLVHLYARGLSGERLSSLVGGNGGLGRMQLDARLTFRPQPPSLSGPLVVLCFYFAALMLLAAWRFDDLFAGNSTGGSTTPVTLLVAIPALTIGWLVPRHNERAIRNANLRAVLEATLLFALSVAASVNSAFRTANVRTTRPEVHPLAGFTLTVNHPYWTVMTSLAVALALATALDVYLSFRWHTQAVKWARI